MTARTWLLSGSCLLAGLLAGLAVPRRPVLLQAPERPHAKVPPAGAARGSPPAGDLRPVDARELASAGEAFPGWQEFAVPQRSPGSGCIPTGYEVLLRAGHVEGIDFAGFQERFDLGPARNNFEAVAAAVGKEHPQARIAVRRFRSGAEKLRFVEERLARRQPTLISLAMSPGGGWHIMPVMDSSDADLILLYMVGADGSRDVRALAKAEFVRRHDEWPGGDDVAFLETAPAPPGGNAPQCGR